MAKKIIRNKEITKATRKFTDREQPRKVFWDKYDSMKQNLHELDDILELVKLVKVLYLESLKTSL